MGTGFGILKGLSTPLKELNPSAKSWFEEN